MILQDLPCFFVLFFIIAMHGITMYKIFGQMRHGHIIQNQKTAVIRMFLQILQDEFFPGFTNDIGCHAGDFDILIQAAFDQIILAIGKTGITP